MSGAAVVIALALAATGLTPAAMADGGSSIASAPTVTYGKQELGNTATGQKAGSCWRSYWMLPVLAGDQVTVAWEGVPETDLIIFPVGTTDYTYFQTDSILFQELSANGKNQAQFSASVSGEMPLVFQHCFSEPEPGPYDFTAVDKHGLAAGLTPTTYIYPTSAISGTAHLVDGSAAPDGMVFNLVAKWHSNGQLLRWATSASSAAGGLAFQLALPQETTGKKVRLAISRAEDGAFLAVRSAPINVQVVGAPAKHRRHHHRRHRHRHHHHHHR
jgi:hypothetical protein